jgi:hypothetical protein
MENLQFSEFHKKLINLVGESKTNCRGRHSILCAINHLNKSWNIRNIDPEMSVFRAITAEEESVSGVFHALIYRGYNNSKLLNPKSHIHKNAAIPFLQSLGYFFDEIEGVEKLSPTFHIKEENGETRLRIALSVNINGQDLLGYPIPPLNFGVTMDGKSVNFEQQIERIVKEQNASNILKYIKEQANLRNRILYAGATGYPSLTDLKDSFFELRKTRVMAMVMAFLLIEPWVEPQPFVQNVLDAFLLMLNIVNHKDSDTVA